MNYSLNEVEATAKRAARGAGYTWGLSEEAGKATRWLCSRGFDGLVELARLLQLGFGEVPGQHAPSKLANLWEAERNLCPLMSGASFSDASHLIDDGAVQMKDVAAPLLLLPFVANVALRREQTVCLSFDGKRVFTDGTQVSILDEVPQYCERITIAKGGDLSDVCQRQTRAIADPSVWNSLNTFAGRTFAPATEESRLRGAGAGLTDSD